MQSAAHNQKGVSILAAIFIVVVLAFMGVVFLSLFSAGTMSSVNDMQSTQALYLAEGGLQYALRSNSVYTWFSSYITPTTTLGSGTFRVESQWLGTGGIAPATVNGPLDDVSPSFNVSGDTTNYNSPGTIKIDSEYIFCTGKSGSSFFGCIRAWKDSQKQTHASGADITQWVVTSTGVVGGASRVVRVTLGQ